MLEFNYEDGDQQFDGKLAFDFTAPFIQVSLQQSGEWSYFDLNLEQLVRLKKFVSEAIEIIALDNK